MAICTQLNDENLVVAAVNTPVESCGGYVLVTPTEYANSTLSQASINQVETLFQHYFAFDEALFFQLQGYMLIAMVIGFSTGKIVSTLSLLNKSN